MNLWLRSFSFATMTLFFFAHILEAEDKQVIFFFQIFRILNLI